MITTDHQNIPVGTVADCRDDRPVTLRRDYSHALIPEMELDIAGLDQLAAILPDLRAQMAACEAEMAEDADDDPNETARQYKASKDDAGSEMRTGNCPACWHLWKLHGPRGCTAASGPASLDIYVCPCEHPKEN